MWREENVKRRRSQKKICLKLRMPREETSTESAWNDSFKRQQWRQERLVRREECVKPLASELLTRRAVKIQKCQEQARSRESGSIKQRCREKEMSRTETSEITQSTAVPARRSAAVPIGSPLSLLSKLPSPGLPGLYLYILYIWLYVSIVQSTSGIWQIMAGPYDDGDDGTTTMCRRPDGDSSAARRRCADGTTTIDWRHDDATTTWRRGHDGRTTERRPS